MPASESSQREQTLKQLYQPLLDGLIDAAVIVDKSLKPLLWNAAYLQVVGVRAKRFGRLIEEQRRCRDLFKLEVCETGCIAARAFATGRALRMDELHGVAAIETPGEPHDNKTLIVSATPIHDDSGAVTAVLEVYRDVTAEARIQERYKVLLDRERQRAQTLEEQVKERTAELSHSLEALQETRAQLVQSEKLSSLGQLVAGIAHEINNPINFIYGNTAFLTEYTQKLRELIVFYDGLTLSPEDQAKVLAKKAEVDLDYVLEDTVSLLKAIRSGAERATVIIRDLRSFMHGGGKELTALELTHCLDTTLNLVTHQAKGRNVTIRRNYAEPAALILGNEGQLGQVFMNLVVNAIQAVADGGEIVITQSRRDGGIAVDVADNGMGISEANLLKVFDPFFTTKPVGTGTGLGLSISYSIVNGHGGRLSVKSKVGQGATFTVWLPEKTSSKKGEGVGA